MDIPNGGELPPDATIIFHVSGGRVRPKGGPCSYIDADGFVCHDDGISVTWVELFGNGDEAFAAAAVAMRGNKTFRSSGVVASANVGTLTTELAADGVDIAVVRDIIPENDGHCLIKGIEAGNIPKLMMLAAQISGFTAVPDIPGLLSE